MNGTPDLSGKTVVITGSTYGIGLATARACGRAGSRTVVSSRRGEAVEKVVAELRAEGIEASGTACDVRDPVALQGLLSHSVEEYGGVDVWVNNAGLGGGYHPLDDIGEQSLRDIVDVNIVGTMLGCRMMVPYFRERGGIILNLGGRGSGGEAAPFGAPYAATKAAVTSLTKSLAKENAGLPISIHEIVPGMVRTGFFEDLSCSEEIRDTVGTVEHVLDAIGMPADEVGELVARVASQEPGRLTGKRYAAFRGARKVRGAAKLAWYGMTGRLTSARRTP